ncbi:GSCOCG00010500001-RA-CDS [Cotesia congregata]|uniref:Uncharacterized protein n=1 Tax=Cotesia congregata TaxID=51543 RepID=A0A8J2MAZ9_COTCN|nr:GSCOCG00010500001-RA-CDS [Cotesia congregata]CAG5080734.1 Protein of unknown function [Cotesia congregata]
MADTELQLVDNNALNNTSEKVESTSATEEQDVQEPKPEACDNTTEPSLLEDVTMPSYLSITTSTISSAQTEEPKVSQDNNGSNGDDKSVYEVSSDDENDREYYRNNREDQIKDIRINDAKKMRYYQEERRRYRSDSEEDDDDEDDEEDDDEDDENEEDDEDDDDDDDEEEDEDLEKYKRYDRSEDEYEADKFERSSDDYVIRPSVALGKDCKKRSASMEELSPRKRTERNNKRLALPAHFEEMSGHPEVSLISNPRKNTPGRNYNHITSKVKQYIQDGQERRRLSAQRRSVDKINADGKRLANDNDTEEETDTLRLNPQCKRLKEYAALSLKNIAAEDPLSIVEVNLDNHITANGKNTEADTKNNKQDNEKAKIEIEVNDDDDDDEDTTKSVTKVVDKVNGVIEHSNDIEKVYQKDEEEIDQPENLSENNPLAILSVQTLTSEEFASNSYREVNEGEIDNFVENNIEKETEEITVDPLNILQINSQSIGGQELSEEMSEESLVKQEYENTVRELMYQLEKKNSDCAQIGQDYQNAVRENLGMKTEMENLRKALEYQQEIQRQHLQQLQQQQQTVLEQQQKIKSQEKKMREQQEQIQTQQQLLEEQRMLVEQEKAKNVKKVESVAIQTDDPPKTMVHSSTKTNLVPPSSNESTFSTGLTISAIEQWTDSESSPMVSLKPPNVDHLLNSVTSDSGANSEANTTEKKSSTATTTPRSASRAVLTTTRIIETLARMTPGKLNGSDSQGQSKDPINPLIMKANNCKKRKASESFGTADNGPQPFKIPTIIINDEKKFNSNSDTDAAVKSSGASQSAASQSGFDKKAGQHLNDGEDKDDVKCIIWHEDEVTKQRSCLIQANVPPDESAKTKGKLRQCGPYLLGNVEVRISEANGTLNIWGKELTSTSSAEEDEECEEFINCEHIWPKSSDKNGVVFSSDSKKVKTSSTMRTGISKLRSMLTRTPSPVNDHEENLCCSNNQRTKFRKRNHGSGSNNQSSHSLDKSFCCLHKGDISLGNCGFGKDDMMEDNIHSLYDMTKTIIGRESSRPASPHGWVDARTFVKNNSRIEEPCRHSSRRCSYNETDDAYLRDYKSCNHSPVNNSNHQDNPFYQDFKHSRINQCCSNCPKSETFIRPGKIQTAEVKKLRDKGKRFKTIKDLLKSCGNPHTTSFDSSFIPETVTTAQSNPSMMFNSVFPSASCSKQTNSSYKKCCTSCEKRIGIASEMESELEKIRNEIAKLYSKSDEMRELLNTLRSVEN